MNPVTVAIVNDYDVVVRGVDAMLRPHVDRVRVVELDIGTEPSSPVDVALYDTFAQAQADADDIDALVANPMTGKVVVYSWNTQPTLVRKALERGCAGYVAKSATAEELVRALERVAAGETVTPGTSDMETSAQQVASGAAPDDDHGRWPGQEHGLSAREAEILGLITQGLTNDDIAARAYLSINTVKSYIRSAYAKIGVTRRPQAVRWGMEHGMLPTKGRELR